MASVVELPRLSDTMEEGVVAKWLIKVGDKVKRGQVIAEIETDKATMEFESFDKGVVLELVAQEGEALPLGAPIAVLGEPGEDPKEVLAALGGSKPEPAAAPAEEAPASAPASEAAPTPASAAAPAAAPVVIDEASQRIPASPLARQMAREAGIPLSAISGSGPHGRVIKADVEKAIAEGVRAPTGAPMAGTVSGDVDENGRPYVSRPDTTVKLTQMRKVIVKRMNQSMTEAPHFYLTVDVDMGPVVKLRKEYNAAIEPAKISFNDVVILAAARALREHPRVNATYTADGIIEHGDVHMGVAVAIDDGLVVPVVRYADQKTLKAIGGEVRDLGGRARDRKLDPQEMSGSTFTVSNLGMFGIHEFTAVINPGEGAILAVGGIEDRAVVVNGQLAAGKRMKMTMSCDHRVIDGAVGAQFLKTLVAYLEHPLKLFT